MKKSKLISLLKELRKISGDLYLFGNNGTDDITLKRILFHYNKLYKIILDKELLDNDHFDLKGVNDLNSISSTIFLLINYLDDTE